MRIFITGGGGFIGRHLVSSLLKSNHVITIFDNFSNTKKQQIQDLFEDKISIVNGDIRNYNCIYEKLSNSEVVIHLAAKIDVNESIKNPIEYNEVNVSGTVNLLQACVKKNINKIIFASSAAVYGNPVNLPLVENMSTNPLSPYGASKLAAEKYLQAFSNSYNLNSISLRFFNIYGIDQTIQYAGVITKFIKNIENNLPLIIYGNGEQTRDFISIYDVIKSIENSILKIEGKHGNVYNIGTGKSITINELIRAFESILNRKLKIEYKEKTKGGIENSYADISLAKKELNFYPEIDITQGLKEILTKITD